VNLQTLYSKYNYAPHQIWNVDETKAQVRRDGVKVLGHKGMPNGSPVLTHTNKRKQYSCGCLLSQLHDPLSMIQCKLDYQTPKQNVVCTSLCLEVDVGRRVIGGLQINDWGNSRML